VTSILLAAVVLVGALGIVNLALLLAVVRRLRALGPGGDASGDDPAGLPVGSVLPDFRAAERDSGEPVTGALLADGGFLAFLRADCHWCWEKFPAMAGYLRDAGIDRRRVLFVVIEDVQLPSERWESLAELGTVVAETPGGPLGKLFDLRATPSYVLVGAGATVRAWTTDPAELPRTPVGSAR
jgi:hypothetical protein